MATGTPRPTFLKSSSSSDAAKTWMSFEESPVHSGGNVHQEERWTSFIDSAPQVAPVDLSINLQLASPAPNDVGQPQPRLAMNTGQPTRSMDASILNRTGIGTDGQHGQQLLTHPALVAHAGTQPVMATHGPGSTISHILRHKSGDTDHENTEENRNASSKHHQGDAVLDSRDLRPANMSQHQAPEKPTTADNYYGSGTTNRANANASHDPWFVTDEQSTYYRNQFSTMQPNIDGKITGQTARNFFTKSRLPIPELSHIWELCDMDQDGHLTLLEFCAAFHLVVARKNGYELPAVLPKTLLPPLIKMCGIGNHNIYGNKNLTTTTDVPPPDQTPVTDMQRKEEKQPPVKVKQLTNITKTQPSGPKNELPASQSQSNDTSQWQTHQEKWETFSDRTSSSTTLANFDQSLEHPENLIQPVPLRMTPSKHEAHSAKMRKEKPPPKSTDDDEHHAAGLTVPPSHKSLTNPYGPLQNNLSEPDSHTSLRPRSLSNSSHSSTGTSDRSLSEIDASFKPPKLNPSDQEYQSDWSSRPLQPRSGSDSSIESSSMEASVIACDTRGSVPTPPPRPNQQMLVSKSDSFDGDNHHLPAADVPDSAKAPMPAPTPPPRPQQSTAGKPAEQDEGFADFSRFEKNEIEDSKNESETTSPSESVVTRMEENKPGGKPTPAPRLSREEKPIKAEAKEEKSLEKGAHRKAPTKPPRSRIQSVDSAVHEHNKIIKTSSIASPSDDIPIIAEKPTQKDARSKVSLQQSIRDLKFQNSKLTRLNADLQQELKDVMQSRITVEMSIHHLRPFSQ